MVCITSQATVRGQLYSYVPDTTTLKISANGADAGSSRDRGLWEEHSPSAVGNSGRKAQRFLVKAQRKRHAVRLAVRHGKMLNKYAGGLDTPGLADSPRPTRNQVWKVLTGDIGLLLDVAGDELRLAK